MPRLTEPELFHSGVAVPEQPLLAAQLESDVFGFWVFLMSDAVIFALLFGVFGTMIGAGNGSAPSPDRSFRFATSFLETLALLSSSFTYGMVSFSLRLGLRRRWVALWLAITFGLGAIFLALELQDFADMIRSGAGPAASGALSAFFVLVGTHGLHVTCGLVWIVMMAAQMAIHGLDQRVRINLIRLGLFWHFLDVVWVGIFSVVYLRGLLG